MPMKVEVLFIIISMYQLHFGSLQGPQLPIAVVCASGILPVNVALISMSRKLFDCQYAITGHSLKM